CQEEDAREKGYEGECDGLGLGIGFAGDENADRKRNKKIGKREEGEKYNTAVNGNLKDKAHEGENQRQFGKTDRQIGKELAEEKTHGAHRRDEQLCERAPRFVSDDGEDGEERGE